MNNIELLKRLEAIEEAQSRILAGTNLFMNAYMRENYSKTPPGLDKGVADARREFLHAEHLMKGRKGWSVKDESWIETIPVKQAYKRVAGRIK